MKQSAGILLYRLAGNLPQVFLVHPGGPFFKNKDAGAWSVPKGEFTGDEDALAAARREFTEETGSTLTGDFKSLTPIKLKSGKTVYCWAVEGDMDAAQLRSNLFEMEWPPRSGKMQSFPEVDRGEWFMVNEAKLKINPAQVPLIDQLLTFI